MEKWEYKIVSFKSGNLQFEDGENVHKKLNVKGTVPMLDYLQALGEQGWEMVQILSIDPSIAVFYFKRKKGETEPSN